MSAEPTAKQRQMYSRTGVAMPDGSFYILDGQDLDNAIHAVGRAQPTSDESETARRNAVRKHVIKRANAIKLSSKIPDTWNSDGTLKHSDIEEFLAHFGRRGMKWGEHVFGRDRSGGSNTHTHSDAKDANILKDRVRQHGTGSLSNNELQTLVTRLNLEKQHGSLSPVEVSRGHRIVSELLSESGGVAKSVAKQTAAEFGKKYAVKGLEELIKSQVK